MISEMIDLCVAGLVLRVDARGTGLSLTVPTCHEKFVQPINAQQEQCPLIEGGEVSQDTPVLIMRVRNMRLPESYELASPLLQSENWELWSGEDGSDIFVAPRDVPVLQIVVDPGYAAAEVFGEFSKRNGAGFFPLENLGIKIFANWLALTGDFILHASGVIIDGQGYCFIGPSGIGKSTLAAALSTDPSVTVLGEDNVILRFINGQFLIYGTPWHLNPAMCSPQGIPLLKLFFLERDPEQWVKPLSAVEGVTRALQTAFIPYYRQTLIPGILDRLKDLSEQVPFYRLSYTLGSDIRSLICDS